MAIFRYKIERTGAVYAAIEADSKAEAHNLLKEFVADDKIAHEISDKLEERMTDHYLAGVQYCSLQEYLDDNKLFGADDFFVGKPHPENIKKKEDIKGHPLKQCRIFLAID